MSKHFIGFTEKRNPKSSETINCNVGLVTEEEENLRAQCFLSIQTELC